MKLIIATLFIFGTVSTFAADKVNIQITANTEELCKAAAKSLGETEEHLNAMDLDIVEITNCNKNAMGKYVKMVKFRNIIDYNH